MNALDELKNKLRAGGGRSLTALELAVLFAREITVAEHERAAAELATLRAETNHRFVVCTYCGWRLDYESEKREAARESANAHALECEKDPRNIENAALRARVGELEQERDELKTMCVKAYFDIYGGVRFEIYNAIGDELSELYDAALAKGAK